MKKCTAEDNLFNNDTETQDEPTLNLFTLIVDKQSAFLLGGRELYLQQISLTIKLNENEK